MSGPVLESKEAARRLAKDQSWFLPIFVVKVTLGLVAFAFKPALGLVFFAAYAAYFWREIRGSSAPDASAEGDNDLEPLKIQPRATSLLATLRAGRLTAGRLTAGRLAASAGLYGVFAVGLVPVSA